MDKFQFDYVVVAVDDVEDKDSFEMGRKNAKQNMDNHLGNCLQIQNQQLKQLVSRQFQD